MFAISSDVKQEMVFVELFGLAPGNIQKKLDELNEDEEFVYKFVASHASGIILLRHKANKLA